MAAEAPLQGSLEGASVLMVEDNPVNMLIAAAMLEQWGVRIEQASDGQQAVQAVQRRAQNGADVRRGADGRADAGDEWPRGHARAAPRPTAPSSCRSSRLTAAALVSERDEALAAGMNDFLTKPIDAQRLQQALLRWVVVRRDSVAQNADPPA